MIGDVERQLIQGEAAVYDTLTNMGYYMERVMVGFFEGINDERCACLKNHDPNLILGRKSNDTLELKYTKTGLFYKAILPDTQSARDTYTEVEGGYISQSSFAFRVKESRWLEVDRSTLKDLVAEDELDRMSYGGKVSIRELVKGSHLFDVSPVLYPAYGNTSSEIAKRSFEEWRQSIHPKQTTNYNLRLRLAQSLNF